MKERLVRTYDSFLQNRDIPRYLYFVALILYVLIRTWDTTMYPRIMLFNNLGLVTAFFLVGVKMLFFDGFTRLEILLDAAALIIGSISYLHGGSVHFIFVFWFVMGAHDVDFQDIIKVYLIVVASVFLLALIGSKLEIIEDLLYDINEWNKTEFLGRELAEAHALGGIYSTDTAARFFFWCLSLFYVAGEKTEMFYSAFFLVLAYTVYVWTHGRLDSICLLMLSFIAFLDGLIKISRSRRLMEARKKLCSFLAILAMPAAAIFSIFVAWFYGTKNAVFLKLNEILSDRLRLGFEAIEKYGINLFGHEMVLVGNGGIAQNDPMYSVVYSKYNYVDVSFVQILLMNGLLVLLILVLIYMIIAWKQRSDTCLMICICLIALNCTVAQHLLDISYVPFILALNAVNSRVPQKPRQQIFNLLPWS